MKTSLLTNEIVQQIKDTYKKEQSIRITRDKVNELLNISLTYHNVRDVITDLIEEVKGIKDELEELNEDIKENKKLYEVDETHYTFILKHNDSRGNVYDKEYKIEINTIDNIFKDYSKYGHNLSGEEILQKYKLKPEVWGAIKSRLRLYKSSHILSPITLERASTGELDEYITEAIEDHLKDKYKEKFINTYEKRKEKDYEVKSKILANIDNTLEHISSYLEGYKPKEYNLDVLKAENNDEIAVLFSDIHLGKMNSDDVLKRLDILGNEVANRNERIVNLICLGDLFETLVKGGMHIGQVENMDGLFGFDLLMKGVEVIETLILKIYKSGKDVKFYGMGGNHDRFTKLKEDGFAGIGAYITYELIKRGLANIKVEINILKQTWNVLDIDDIRFILNHGDNGVAKKGIVNGQKILWEFGDSSKYNIIASGDLHHLEMNNNSDKSMSLIVPALAGRNEYDTNLGLSSNPGFIIIKKGINGKPNILINQL